MCVGPQGRLATFASQTNLVVWDAAHGTEHFVRDAKFLTNAKDLGFIAPTPSRPVLSDVDPTVFDTLESFAPPSPGAATAGAMEMTKSAGSVSVIETKDVAGYRATVLRATDEAALIAWLQDNGYPAPAFARAWAAPYVRRGWYFTAFKVKGGQNSKTGPVRMSFATKTPFNPYSVPAQNGRGGHVPLRLYYLSAGEEVPRIGGKAAVWRNPEWSVKLGDNGPDVIARSLHLGRTAIPEHARLTAYQDDRFGTPGLDDLYFVGDRSPEPSTRSGLIAGGGLALAALVAGGVLRKRKKA